MAEEMFLIEARRERRGERPAGIARFIVTAGSKYAALSRLRVYYDTSDLDSLTAHPISGVVPIGGALVHEMVRTAEPETSASRELARDEDEPWKNGRPEDFSSGR